MCICALGFIFLIDPFWRNMFFKLRGAHTYIIPHVAKEMHPSTESLVVIGAPNLHASLMDIHHDTSLRSILEADSISLASRTCICSCSSRGQGYGWLLGHLFVRFALHTLFSPQHCIFVSVWFSLRYLIIPCVSVDTSWTHLAHI
jgi:hypothetical protein